MLLDRAPETVKIYDVEWRPDGYGGGRAPEPGDTYTTHKAFIMPTGFAGAGWAVNIRFGSQGWADTARITLVMKWTPELDRVRQWYQVEAQGRIWTVVQAPRLWTTSRMKVVTMLCELRGDPQ